MPPVKWIRRTAWTLLLVAVLVIFGAGMLVLSLDLSTPALHMRLR